MGTVVISLDAELGWGFHDLPEPPLDRVECARRGWSVLLSTFEEYDVPATWAVVGHLLLDNCDGRHRSHPAPEGWFERERTDWRNRTDLRFGPDLVQALLDSPVDHEIGCHSFSHVLFDDPDTTSKLALAECRRCLELADDWGLRLESFVFPRNGVAHRDVLAESGFQVYRGRPKIPDGPRGVFTTLVERESQLVRPTIDDHGLVNVPASTFLFGFEGRARSLAESVWTDPMVTQVRRGIDEAAANDGVFHLWFHPNNLLTERHDERVRATLEYVARRRDDGDVTVETMGAVGRRVLAESGGRSADQVLDGR